MLPRRCNRCTEKFIPKGKGNHYCPVCFADIRKAIFARRKKKYDTIAKDFYLLCQKVHKKIN